ncbi:histidine kinase [Corynebacterium sp. H127]
MTEALRVLRNVRIGDDFLAGIAVLLSILMLLSALSSGEPSDWRYFALSIGFVITLLFNRAYARLAGFGSLALLTAWQLNWVSQLPENSGYAPYLAVAPLAIYNITRYSGLRWGRIAGVWCALGSLISPFSFTMVDGNWVYPDRWELLQSLAFHWFAIFGVYMWAARARAQGIRVQREREQDLLAARQREHNDIAREIHDVLAHSLTLMNVQANAGLIAGKQDNQAALAALTSIKETSAESLAEVRAMIGSLRDVEIGNKVWASPEGFVSESRGVIEDFRSTGINVVLAPKDVLPEVQGLPPRILLALHRVLVEGLTNVLRHQGSESTVMVKILRNPKAISLNVLSTGAYTATQEGSGTGLVGLQERLKSLGGQLSATPSGSNSFKLQAVIPLVSN